MDYKGSTSVPGSPPMTAYGAESVLTQSPGISISMATKSIANTGSDLVTVPHMYATLSR